MGLMGLVMVAYGGILSGLAKSTDHPSNGPCESLLVSLGSLSLGSKSLYEYSSGRMQRQQLFKPDENSTLHPQAEPVPYRSPGIHSEGQES